MSRANGLPGWIVDIGAGLIVAAVSMAATLGADSITRRGWFTPGDFWLMVRGAQFVADGAVAYLYESGPHTALPLFFVMLAPFYAIGRALGLSEAYPIYLERPTMWLVVGPPCLLLAAPLLSVIRGWTTRTMGVVAPTVRRELGTTAVVFGFLPCFVWGHFEDVAAATALIASLRLDNPRRSGWWLAIAISLKQWSVLALPVLAVSGWREDRWGGVRSALLLPIAVVGTILCLDWPHASRALLRTPNFPQFGHHMPWVSDAQSTVAAAPYRLALLGVAIGVAYLCREASTLRRLTAAVATVLMLRGILEPVVHLYYVAPGIVLCAMHEVAVRGRCRRTCVLAVVLFSLFLMDDRWWWWPSFALLMAVVVAPAARDLAGRTVEATPQLHVAPAAAYQG